MVFADIMPFEQMAESVSGRTLVLSSEGIPLRRPPGERLEEFLRHASPPGPVVAGALAPDVEPVRNGFRAQYLGKAEVLGQTDVLLACRQDDLHLLVTIPVPAVIQI